MNPTTADQSLPVPSDVLQLKKSKVKLKKSAGIAFAYIFACPPIENEVSIYTTKAFPAYKNGEPAYKNGEGVDCEVFAHGCLRVKLRE